MFTYKKNHNKGFSLLEILLVLAIAAALVIGAFVIYPKAQSSQRVQLESYNISTIQSGIKSLYTSVSNYNGLTNQVALNADIFPENMVDGTTVRNSFKGVVNVLSGSTGPSGVAGSSFIIQYMNVPAAECVKLISAVGSNFYIIQVTGTPVKSATVPLDVATTTSACRNATTNTIVFTSL